MKEKTHDRIIISLPIKSQSQKKFSSKFKSKKSLMFLFALYIIILVILAILFLQLLYSKRKSSLSSKNFKSKRNLQNERFDPSNYPEDKPLSAIDIGILVFYSIFLSLTIYLGCELKSKTKSDELFYNVLKYIYMSNNGYMFISLIDNSLKTSLISLLTLIVGLLIFIVGTFIYLAKFCKEIFSNFFEKYFGFEMLKSWYNLPCISVWEFISVTDPCCRSDTYTTYINNGRISDDKCIIKFGNNFAYFMKRLVLFLSTIFFYVFMIIITVPWFIIKLIYSILKNVKCNRSNSQANIPNNNAGNFRGNNIIIGNSNAGNNANINENNINNNILKKNKIRKKKKKIKKNKSMVIPNSIGLENAMKAISSINRSNLTQKSQDQSVNSQNNNSSKNQNNQIIIQDV